MSSIYSDRRRFRDIVKRTYFLFYRLGIKMGVSILPVHYYTSEPDIVSLRRELNTWAFPSTLPGVKVDLDRQAQDLEMICRPFMSEYIGNTVYTDAVKSGYGPGFGYIEAQVLHSVMRYFKPEHVLEVGSGVSTYCSYIALERNRLESGRGGQITCVEPYPSRQLVALADAGGVRLISQPVQQLPLETFEDLGPGDVLFIDSSHVVKAGSDVNRIILEILPRLSRGVIIHFHDIYFPFDYQRDLLETFIHNNETSLLRAFLMFNDRFNILFSLSHLHYEREGLLRDIFPEYVPQSGFFGLRNERYDPNAHFPSSTWLTVTG